MLPTGLKLQTTNDREFNAQTNAHARPISCSRVENARLGKFWPPEASGRKCETVEAPKRARLLTKHRATELSRLKLESTLAAPSGSTEKRRVVWPSLFVSR